MSEPRPPKREGGTRTHSHPVQAWSPPPTTGPPNVCELLDENLSRWWDFKSKPGLSVFTPHFPGVGMMRFVSVSGERNARAKSVRDVSLAQSEVSPRPKT